MTTPSPGQWGAARRFLDADGGSVSTAAQSGEAVVKLHAQLRLGLAPLIGSSGFDALFARAIRLTASGHDGGVSLRNLRIEPSAAGGEQLGDYLAQQEPIVAAESAVAVLAHFFALMTTFIGARLTDKILLQVGFPIATPHPRENDK